MQVNMDQFYSELEKAETVVLATSMDNLVTVRQISPIRDGERILIRTDGDSRKAVQMRANPRVALSMGGFDAEAEARPLGSTEDPQNAARKQLYIERYPGAFTGEDEYLSDKEVFFELKLAHVSQWIYENDVPVGFAQLDLK